MHLLVKLVDDVTDDDLELCKENVAKQIVKETKEKKINQKMYCKHIDKDIASACVSETLLHLLAAVSPKFDYQSLQSPMIGNIIASVVASQATSLQIALGVLMSNHKAS